MVKDENNRNFSDNNVAPMDTPGTSGLNHREKVNLWQQADGVANIPMQGAHNPEQEDLQLEGVLVYDQQRLEQGMMDQMNEEMNERQRKLEASRATRELKRLEVEIRIKKDARTLEIVLSESKDKETRNRAEKVKRHKLNKENQLKMLQAKRKRLQKVAGILPSVTPEEEDIAAEDIEKAASSSANWAFTGKGEEERERLIRLGLMTPFGSMAQDDQEKETKKKKVFLDDGFSNFLTTQEKPKNKPVKEKPLKKSLSTEKSSIMPKKKNNSSFSLKAWTEVQDCLPKSSDTNHSTSEDRIETKVMLKDKRKKDTNATCNDDDDYIPNEEDLRIEQQDLQDEKSMQDVVQATKRPRYNQDTGSPVYDYDDDSKVGPSKKAKLNSSLRVVDDGKLANYKKRMKAYQEQMHQESSKGAKQPEDKDLGNDYKVPGKIWSRLYKYQRTGVRWLCELHSQRVGGILGDEMGLGKTVQIIAFLATVRRSKIRSRSVPGYPYEGLGPVLIITPTTVMHQWVKEFHAWWPEMRVAILHDSGTYESSRAQLVDHIAQSNGILITSYERARINIEMLLEQGWHYVILDEGHKIRNPEAAVTVALKTFRTPHRLILSGSPVQNNLKELWSLFDFIFPGKLGTLPVFMEQFSIPIVQGGYSNATEIQVHTAYKCACKLRDTISPYLLRRMKRDVQLSLDLPSKNEQVLFCWLSKEQIEVYKKYLDSDQVHSILTREMKVFAGLIQLRKICNHPDLYTGGPKIMVGETAPNPRDPRSFGYYKRSGKMLVIASLLKSWKKQNHKVLLFTQSKAMLVVLEIYVSSHGYNYLTMHGGTPIQTRQPLINRFNTDPSLFVFLLTTRVGGLGVNLTGADRVVIFDPDWNPSTDSQAQERAWRIGQRRDVTIYRLLTLGTIEEKIYHRQIFKQFLTNRVLKDPWQRRFFKSNDLHELFLLKDYGSGGPSRSNANDADHGKSETAAIFAGTGSEVKPELSERKLSTAIKRKEKPVVVSEDTYSLSSNGLAKQKESPQPNNDNDSSANKSPDSHVGNTATSEVVSRDNISVEVNPLNCSNNNIKTEENQSYIVGNSPVANKTSGNLAEDAKKSSSLKESLLRAMEKFKQRKQADAPEKRAKKRKRRKHVVDGESVKNLASVEDYKSNKGASEEIEEKSRKATDDYVLHKLFKRAGVHSALQHNTIMDSAHPDYALVEVEAERVAKESVRNLKLSRQQYRYPTGRKPGSSKPRFGKKASKEAIDKDDSAILKSEKTKGLLFNAAHLNRGNEDSPKADSDRSNDSPTPLSASQLLSMMRRRNHEEIHKQEQEDDAQRAEEDNIFGYSVSQINSASATVNPTEHDELMEDVRNFVAFGCQIDGRAKTSEIMAEFGDKVEPSHAPIFKSILKELCTSEDVPGAKEKTWFLKPEFR